MTASQSGTLWGVSWERYPWGVACYALHNGHLVQRKYAGNGSDPVRVRDCVRSFTAEVMRGRFAV